MDGFRRSDPGPCSALYDLRAGHVHWVLYRLLGFHRNLADLHHDVFVRTVGSLSKLEDPSAPEGGLTMIAVHEARSSIACMKQCSWLWFLRSDERPEVESGVASGEVLDALRATYAAPRPHRRHAGALFAAPPLARSGGRPLLVRSAGPILARRVSHRRPASLPPGRLPRPRLCSTPALPSGREAGHATQERRA
ncbi:hypothetical protein [Sorangium sp. So ce542]|uniref:hypothetical protein n=1 Tax=Sorangium sp. So ce542 TaxID=3133316 RepID=UPI003F619B70